MTIFYLIYSFIFGAIIGSFLNVVIYRVPRHESIVVGSSHCPSCMTPIKPYDLIPVVSYFMLRGKCRQCGSSISFRYPLIEFITAVLFALTFLTYDLTFQTLIGVILAAVLVIITMIDIDTMEIYDRFQLIILGLAVVSMMIGHIPLMEHFIGFFVVSIPFMIIAYLSEGLGGGDIKLVAIAGLLLGYKDILVAFFIASISGGIFGLYLMLFKKKHRKTMIAFGPFLCVGIYIAYLYGARLFDAYLALFA